MEEGPLSPQETIRGSLHKAELNLKYYEALRQFALTHVVLIAIQVIIICGLFLFGYNYTAIHFVGILAVHMACAAYILTSKKFNKPSTS